MAGTNEILQELVRLEKAYTETYWEKWFGRPRWKKLTTLAGLCYAIDGATNDKFYLEVKSILTEAFKEIYRHYPPEFGYWFEAGYLLPRLEIIQRAIYKIKQDGKV